MSEHPEVRRRVFGTLPDGTPVEEFRLDNGRGLVAAVLTYGGIIRSVLAPDREGRSAEITLAHDTLDEFLAGHPYYGALVGRVANRISGGGFSLDGHRVALPPNNGDLHLHGGSPGFHEQLYEPEVEVESDSVSLALRRVSHDGEAGYPGNLAVTHRITCSTDMRLVMEFEAETDQATVVNLTNHCYWNLGSGRTILDHELRLNAAAVAEVHELIPTGGMIPVADTPLDFRRLKRVQDDFQAIVDQGTLGFDHSYQISGWSAERPDELHEAAELRCDTTGRGMLLRTTYPDVHFYTGNHLPGSRGRRGESLRGQEALCLECQFFPDSPNRPEFPSIVLRPDGVYHHRTEHRFFTY